MASRGMECNSWKARQETDYRQCRHLIRLAVSTCRHSPVQVRCDVVLCEVVRLWMVRYGMERYNTWQVECNFTVSEWVTQRLLLALFWWKVDSLCTDNSASGHCKSGPKKGEWATARLPSESRALASAFTSNGHWWMDRTWRWANWTNPLGFQILTMSIER